MLLCNIFLFTPFILFKSLFTLHIGSIKGCGRFDFMFSFSFFYVYFCICVQCCQHEPQNQKAGRVQICFFSGCIQRAATNQSKRWKLSPPVTTFAHRHQTSLCECMILFLVFNFYLSCFCFFLLFRSIIYLFTLTFVVFNQFVYFVHQSQNFSSPLSLSRALVC